MVSCHVPAFNTGMSPGLWHLTFLCSHTCAVAQPTYEAKAKKQVGHTAVRDWNGRPHASPSVDNTRVCLEILSPGYSKHVAVEHPGEKWHALSVQEGIIMENMLLILYRIVFQITRLLLNSSYL